MKKISAVVVLLFASITTGSAQYTYFVNPGIKLGYTFGQEGGFTFGFEVSMVGLDMSKDNGMFGVTLDYDYVGDLKKLHVGGEYLYRFTGIDIGPTFGWIDRKSYSGMSIIPFGGVMFYPYYNYTYFDRDHQFHEAGSYMKIPIGDGRLRIGG